MKIHGNRFFISLVASRDQFPQEFVTAEQLRIGSHFFRIGKNLPELVFDANKKEVQPLTPCAGKLTQKKHRLTLCAMSLCHGPI